jgi:hypothetical protein
VFAILVFPTFAWGAELDLAIATSMEYDDNVFRVTEGGDKETDFVFRLSPRVALEDKTQNLNYRVNWSVPFTKGIQTSRISDFDNFVGVRFSYRLSDKTRLWGSDRFSHLRSLAKIQDEVVLEDLTTVLQISKEEERNYLNSASLGMSHQFTSDLSGSMTLAHNFFDTTRDDRRQVNTVAASGSLSYAVDSKNRIGAGVGFTRQDFEDLVGNPGSETMIYRIFASWAYRFDETLSFSVRAGPALFDNDQRAAEPVVRAPNRVPFFILDDTVWASRAGSCPLLDGTPVIVGAACGVVLEASPAVAADIQAVAAQGPFDLTYPDGPPGSEADQQVDIFVNATLSKRWSPRLSSSLAYRRSESGASGLAGTATLDSVTVTTSWRATELWTVGVRTDWTLRQSVFPIPRTFRAVEPWPDHPELAWLSGDLVATEQEQAIDTQRWGVGARLARKLSRNLNATLRLTYNRQKSEDLTAGTTSDFNNFLAVVGVQYNFDRIELW